MNEQLATTTLVVIDDDPDVLRATARILVEAGYRVITGGNAAQAVALTREHRPALLLLDVMLPDGKGTDIARQLKGEAALAGVFVVLVSGLKTSGDEQAAGLASAQADGYIARPFTKSELLAKIEALLRLRQTQESLREARDRLQKIASRVPGVVYEFRLRPDGSSHFPFASEGIRDVYRVSPEEVRDDASKANATIHPDDAPRLVAAAKQSARTLTLWREEYRVRYDDGTVRWLHGNAVPQREADGSTLWHGFITDITERKNAEAELEQHRHHLEDLVFARTAELAQSRDAAQAASRAKTAFLATMSHELRTPMNGIIGMTTLALRRATDPKQIDQLNKALTAAQQLAGIISDMLDIAYIESGQLSLSDEVFSLAKMLEQALRSPRQQAHAKGLNLVLEIAAELPQDLRGDALHLGQMVLNLAENAVKFSEQGTVTVRALAQEPQAHSVTLRVEVSDQGMGVSADEQARLFQPFVQLDDSLTRAHGGAGLGLAVVKRLANLMSGDAGVRSESGNGSTFWFTAKLLRVA